MILKDNIISTILVSKNPGKLLRAQFKNINLPFLKLADEIPGGPLPYHQGSVLDHLCECMDRCAENPLAVWLAMIHDCGKLTTPVSMFPHHYGHELRGENLAVVWSKAVGADDDLVRAAKFTAFRHMLAGQYKMIKHRKRLEFLLCLMPYFFAEAFLAVIDADSNSRISEFIKRDWHNFLQIGLL